MRRLAAALAFAVVLSAPSAANAKAGGLQFCGPEACRTVYDADLVSALLPALNGRDRTGQRPAPPSPFYSVRWAYGDGQVSGLPGVYHVPAARLVRLDDPPLGKWVPVREAHIAFAQATRGLDAFPTPRVKRVTIGPRQARKAATYLRLYWLIAEGESVHDPVGPRPALEWQNYKALVRYYDRDRRLWIPIHITTFAPGPWSDDAAQLSIGRRLDLLRADGTVVRLPHALAARVREGGSL
jgi:hypothetical protein